MPSGDSTPRASGFDSRCSPRSWLTSGGPSSRRLVVYQKVSGRPALFSSKPVALRVATDVLRLSSGLYAFRAPETSYHYNRCGRYGQVAVPAPPWPTWGEDYPISCLFTRVIAACCGWHDPRLIGKTFVIPIAKRPSHD